MSKIIKLEDIGGEVTFDEASHTYKNKDGKILTSATQFLHLFSEPFDKTGIIAYKCSQREGISKDEMQARWLAKNKTACDLGHRVHARIETFLKTGVIEESEDRDIVEDFAKIKLSGKIYSELRLTSPIHKLAGTCDVARLIKKTVTVDDLKTNATFTLKSKYYKKLLFPINHLSDCHINIYSLQILLYGKMIEEHGYSFEPGQILWVNPESRKIQPFEVLDLKKEVNDLLEYWLALDNF